MLLLAGCRAAISDEDLRLNVQPRVLPDDGRRARVIIGTNDAYGDPGTGKVSVRSSAGSLRNGMDLVLSPIGDAETTFTCDFGEDPDCHDRVTVTAEWTAPSGAVLREELYVTITTTDAFVSACAFNNRRRLKLLTGDPPALQLAVLDTMPETARTPWGVSLWDPPSGVGALALSLASRAGDPSQEELMLRGALEPIGALGNPLVQSFTTWDGHLAARSTFDLASTLDVKEVLQAISTAFGAGSTGLQGSTQVRGPFKVELIAVQLELGISSVVIALHTATAFSEAAQFDLEDVAGGSAIASSVDAPVDHCEIFTVEPGKKVDFVWVVDDSCSMESSQRAVATVGEQASLRIQGAQLDFRVGGVSTGFYAPYFYGSERPFTKNLTQMLGWFRGINAFGTGGTGDERGFQGLTSFMGGNMFLRDSEVHIIFLSDTRDHSGLSAADMKLLFASAFPKQRVVVSGIVCPEGTFCGDDRELPVGKYHTLIRETGGVLGSINVFNPPTVTPELLRQQTDTMNRIVGNVVTGAGYQLKYRPITASLRVAASTVKDARCDNRDIPRSVDHGWDLDPITGRLAFYGFCVPALGGTMVVSYKSWARYGTQVHETTTPVYAVPFVVPDGGVADGGVDDGGGVDGGVADGGSSDAGDGG